MTSADKEYTYHIHIKIYLCVSACVQQSFYLETWFTYECSVVPDSERLSASGASLCVFRYTFQIIPFCTIVYAYR